MLFNLLADDVDLLADDVDIKYLLYDCFSDCFKLISNVCICLFSCANFETEQKKYRPRDRYIAIKFTRTTNQIADWSRVQNEYFFFQLRKLLLPNFFSNLSQVRKFVITRLSDDLSGLSLTNFTNFTSGTSSNC